MAAPKQPQDRKPKAEKAAEAFTFEHGGKTYTLKKTRDVLKPSFIRRTRHEGDFGQMCSMIEALAKDDATLDAFDAIMDSDSKKDAEAFSEAFAEHVQAVTGGASTGESQAS